MRRKGFLIILVLALVLTVSLSAALSIGSARQSSTLWLVEHAETDVVTDTGAEGDSVGDILTFANPVFDETNANQVGTDNGYCVRTVVGAAWECFWTMILEDGQLTVEGPFFDAGDSTLAITGGTGAYQNARGQMTLHARNPEQTEYDFTYEIFDEGE